VAAVRQQYERWPYPYYPLLAKVQPLTVWQLNASYLAARAGVADPGPRPRIWIAGCGTFQPHVFATANPTAAILATDLSERSLQLARRRCALRRQRVEFARVDLSDPASLPDGPFDLIECYGVLMCLPDPAAALRALAARLAPQGVLRLMVYPHFSRRRVFQLQRVAQLLGLHHDDPAHPRLFRRAIAALPQAHPLRYAFSTYADARNDQGLADAFLHPFDRGFTGLELGALVAQAGLAPGFFFHRPWADPVAMGPRLGFGPADPFAVLHYLDLWQELRGNFVVCLRRAEAVLPEQAERVHPLLDVSSPGLRWSHRARLLWGQVAGLRLPDKLAGGARRVSARELRRRDGQVVLEVAEPLAAAPSTAEVAVPPEPRIWRGRRAPNPFYAHLLAAWRGGPLPGLPGIGSLADEFSRWRAEAEPLENSRCSFGLTPFGSAAHTDVAEAARLAESGTTTWDAIECTDDARDALALTTLLARMGLTDRTPERLAARRELHNLLCSHASLVLGSKG
jgi:SAM-dependent methyltransferase